MPNLIRGVPTLERGGFRRAPSRLSAFFATLLASTVLLIATAFVAPAVSLAQSADLPPAKELIARYAREVGGESWKRHKSARMKATMEVPAAGIKATMEVLHIFPNVFMNKVDMPGMGEVKSGFDGTVAWSINAMQGPRILTGAEADAARDDADPANHSRLSEGISSSETVEKTSMDGQDCYKVKHTWKSGRETFDCFSVANGLVVATTVKATTQMGEIEVTQLLRDYKDWGGVKRASTVLSQLMGMASTVTVTDWEWDNVDPGELALPPEIKALIKP